MNMKVSVAIPTYKRNESLKNLLQALLVQQYDDFEVIVVDQCPPLSKDLEGIVAANRDKIKYFSFPGTNSAHARNKAAEEAEGEIIICCDDDIVISPDFIKNHVQNYADTTVGAVSGRVLCVNDAPFFKIKKVGTLRKWDGKIIANFNADFKTDIEHAYGCNVSYRRELLIKVGGHDERLMGTSSFDDMDLSFKIKKLGYRIVFSPLAYIEHLQGRGGCRELSFNEKMYWYYHNFMIFYLTHLPKVFFPVFFLRQICGIIRRVFVVRDVKVILYGIRGLRDGFRDYRKKA